MVISSHKNLWTHVEDLHKVEFYRSCRLTCSWIGIFTLYSSSKNVGQKNWYKEFGTETLHTSVTVHLWHPIKCTCNAKLVMTWNLCWIYYSTNAVAHPSGLPPIRNDILLYLSCCIQIVIHLSPDAHYEALKPKQNILYHYDRMPGQCYSLWSHYQSHHDWLIKLRIMHTAYARGPDRGLTKFAILFLLYNSDSVDVNELNSACLCGYSSYLFTLILVVSTPKKLHYLLCRYVPQHARTPLLCVTISKTHMSKGLPLGITWAYGHNCTVLTVDSGFPQVTPYPTCCPTSCYSSALI